MSWGGVWVLGKLIFASMEMCACANDSVVFLYLKLTVVGSVRLKRFE
jgi:hypothetical protein